MPGGNDIMAQSVYMAQIFASRGSCKCKACACLRKGGDLMIDIFLKQEGLGNPGAEESLTRLENPSILEEV